MSIWLGTHLCFDQTVFNMRPENQQEKFLYAVKVYQAINFIYRGSIQPLSKIMYLTGQVLDLAWF